MPANGFWRWPYWDIRNISILSRTRLGASAYVKGKLYFNTFKNGLDAYDDITFTTQSANGRFRSPYDDRAHGAGLEFGVNQSTANTLKASYYYRRDFHTEQQTNRPTNPTLATTEPKQEQALRTWAVALEDTYHVTPTIDLVGGLAFSKYEVTKAEEYNTTRLLFEYPKGGADLTDWQAAMVWHYSPKNEVHASISDRGRFPMLFELYSTRFGTATPNPDLGPERATNVEFGWKGQASQAVRLEAAVFYSDVRDLAQTVQLADSTTQYQNVGDGTFYGAETAIDVNATSTLTFGGNYTALSREIHDALQPTLRPTGVPTHKGFVYAAWRPVARLTITPSLDIAGDRWSDVNTSPVLAFPYQRIGSYNLLNLSAEYRVARELDVVFGFKNINDENYSLSWGLPQPGRTFYFKTRVGL